MPTSLVTGGGGFIGSHLVDALLARGDVVRVLDNFSTGKRENLQHNIEKIQLLTGDLRESEILNEAVQGVDYIFHQAAFISVPQSMEDPDSCFDINVNGTGKLLAVARAAGVKRVVLASSAAVYGENEALPLSEDEEPDPLSPYAASKSINEIYARLFTNHLGLNVVALRYFNVYGPRQNPASDYAAVVPIFIKILEDEGEPVIFGDGLQTRSFCYVDDLIEGICRLLFSDYAYPVNIGNPNEITIKDFAEEIINLTKTHQKVIYKDLPVDDPMQRKPDTTLAKKLLKWEAIVPRQEGMEKTFNYFKSLSQEELHKGDHKDFKKHIKK